MKTQSSSFIVSLYLRGNGLDPDLITRLLGISPTRAQRKGDKCMTTTNHEVVAKTGLWGKTANIESSSVSDHIEGLGSIFGNDHPSIKNIAGVEEAYVDVLVMVSAEEHGEFEREFQLSEANIETLARLGLPVRWTVAAFRED